MSKKSVLILALVIVLSVSGCSYYDGDNKKSSKNTTQITVQPTTQSETDAITTIPGIEPVTAETTVQSETQTTVQLTTVQPTTQQQTSTTVQPTTVPDKQKTTNKKKESTAKTKKKTSKKKTTKEKTENGKNTSVSKPEKTSVSKSDKSAVKRPKNSYYNSKNYKCTNYNRIVIKPKYVRYSGNEIIAECYIVNGFNCTVKNISVKSFKLYDSKKKVICSAEFGKLSKVKIDAYGHIDWRFVFRADCVKNKKASLKKLSWGSTSTFDYEYNTYYYYEPPRRYYYYYNSYCY